MNHGDERQAAIRRKIQRIFPDTDRELLAAQINWVFDQYNTEYIVSRDTHPTRRQMIDAVEKIQGQLDSILARFCEEDGAAIMCWLSAVLDDPYKTDEQSDLSVSFSSKLGELRTATATTLAELHEHDGEFEIDGVSHKRRTRTSVRDRMMIPMLTAIACRNGLSPGCDWEDLDQACDFVTLVLEFAGIPAPDAGRDVAKLGEAAQGRLRRMVKEAARQYQETDRIDK